MTCFTLSPAAVEVVGWVAKLASLQDQHCKGKDMVPVNPFTRQTHQNTV
jgi:hypothetical protein